MCIPDLSGHSQEDATQFYEVLVQGLIQKKLPEFYRTTFELRVSEKYWCDHCSRQSISVNSYSVHYLFDTAGINGPNSSVEQIVEGWQHEPCTVDGWQSSRIQEAIPTVYALNLSKVQSGSLSLTGHLEASGEPFALCSAVLYTGSGNGGHYVTALFVKLESNVVVMDDNDKILAVLRKSPRNSFDIACTINGQAYVLVLALYVIKRVEEDDEWLYEPVMGNFGNLDELLPEEKDCSRAEKRPPSPRNAPLKFKIQKTEDGMMVITT